LRRGSGRIRVLNRTSPFQSPDRRRRTSPLFLREHHVAAKFFALPARSSARDRRPRKSPEESAKWRPFFSPPNREPCCSMSVLALDRPKEVVLVVSPESPIQMLFVTHNGEDFLPLSVLRHYPGRQEECGAGAAALLFSPFRIRKTSATPLCVTSRRSTAP